MQPATLGRYNDVACELILPGRQFRIDFALLAHRIAIEFDGWSNHFRREAAQRDHEKNIFLAKHGWIVLRVSKKLVNNALDEFLLDVDAIRNTREEGRFEVVDGHFICQSCMDSDFASYKSCPGDYRNANKIAQDAELCETCTLMSSD